MIHKLLGHAWGMADAQNTQVILIMSAPRVGWIGGGDLREEGEAEVLRDMKENEIRSFFTEGLDVPALEGWPFCSPHELGG